MVRSVKPDGAARTSNATPSYSQQAERPIWTASSSWLRETKGGKEAAVAEKQTECVLCSCCQARSWSWVLAANFGKHSCILKSSRYYFRSSVIRAGCLIARKTRRGAASKAAALVLKGG